MPESVFQSTLPTRGSDGGIWFYSRMECGISIHAPHEGERPQKKHLFYRARIFQSTLPTRGSDPAVAPPPWVGLWDFNPRSPRGGATLPSNSQNGQGFEFQSTLPTRGSDTIREIIKPKEGYFNPRSPRGGATWFTLYDVAAALHISIHAPHEGERPGLGSKSMGEKVFQSTLPTRGSDLKPAS